MKGADESVLGVDAALRATGVGLIERAGPAWRAVHFAVIRNPPAYPHSRALAHLYAEMYALLKERAPGAVAIEGGFFCRNVRTAITLGQARGVVLAAASAAGIPVYEYAPRAVKQAVVGTGSARKEQVALMVRALMKLTVRPPEDAADALAIALCHAQAHVRRATGSLRPI